MHLNRRGWTRPNYHSWRSVQILLFQPAHRFKKTKWKGSSVHCRNLHTVPIRMAGNKPDRPIGRKKTYYQLLKWIQTFCIHITAVEKEGRIRLPTVTPRGWLLPPSTLFLSCFFFSGSFLSLNDSFSFRELCGFLYRHLLFCDSHHPPYACFTSRNQVIDSV